jgi:hypothetical protein
VIDQDLKELDEWSKTLLMSFNPDKSEIMLFSNTDIPEFNFAFNGSTIPITNSHKRLGVTFSSDAKWNMQVRLRSTSSLYSTSNPQIGVKFSNIWPFFIFSN